MRKVGEQGGANDRNQEYERSGNKGCEKSGSKWVRINRAASEPTTDLPAGVAGAALAAMHVGEVVDHAHICLQKPTRVKVRGRFVLLVVLWGYCDGTVEVPSRYRRVL